MHVDAAIDPHAPGAVDLARGAEALGVRALWVPETWGYDALSGLAFLAARTTTIGLGTFVVQLGSRSPALLATSRCRCSTCREGASGWGSGSPARR